MLCTDTDTDTYEICKMYFTISRVRRSCFVLIRPFGERGSVQTAFWRAECSAIVSGMGDKDIGTAVPKPVRGNDSSRNHVP